MVFLVFRTKKDLRSPVPLGRERDAVFQGPAPDLTAEVQIIAERRVAPAENRTQFKVMPPWQGDDVGGGERTEFLPVKGSEPLHG